METNFENLKQYILKVKGIVESASKNIVVLLVINTKKTGKVPDDYADFSVRSEYFSDEELEEVVTGFQKLGCTVDVSTSETEFIEKLTNNGFEKYKGLQPIVYYSSGSGTGKSRSAVVPALCNLYNLKNCSNDTYTSVLLENKVHLFNLLEFYGYPIPRTWFYDRISGWLKGEPAKDLLLIAKPAYESSSIGITEKSVSKYTVDYQKYIHNLSDSLKQPVLVQEFIRGYEVEVPLFDTGSPFIPMTVGIKIKNIENLGSDFLTYEKVYHDEYNFFSFSKLKPSLGEEMKIIAKDSFTRLNLAGMARVDFRVTENGKCYIIDYNNNPHLTAFHSCAFSVMDLGFSYSDMLCLLLFKYI
jgi:D-alanine-D-alanine ligase